MPSTSVVANADAVPRRADRRGRAGRIGESERDVVVIGAGPAGLSAALELERVGVRPLLLDQAEHVAASWRGRYDRLHLNTPAAHSHLPGRRFPKDTPTFPTRDRLVEHLEHFSRSDGIDLALGTQVEQITRRDERWLVETSSGEIQARQVVVATGYEGTPSIPAWRGRDEFAGRLLHSCEAVAQRVPSGAFNTIPVWRRTSLRVVVSRDSCCRRTCGIGCRRIIWRGS